MKLCPACSRHLRADTTTCPFCQAPLNPSASPLAALSLAAGLLLAGCGGETKAPAVTAPSEPAADPTPSPAPNPAPTPEPTPELSPTPVAPPVGEPVAAYGGPPSTSLRAPPAPPKRSP